MLQRFHRQMERIGRSMTKQRLLRLGWLASGTGFLLVVSLWHVGSDDLLDWLGGLLVLCGRPFAGWAARRAESLEAHGE